MRLKSCQVFFHRHQAPERSSVLWFLLYVSLQAFHIILLYHFRARCLPTWGKHVTQHGQACCPSWADFVLSDRIINCCPSTIGWGYSDITEWQMGLGCFICNPYALGYNLTFPKGSNRLLCLWLQPPLVLPRRGDAGYSVSAIDWWCSLFRFCHRLVMQFTPFLS